MKSLRNIHPGEILLKEFLVSENNGLSAFKGYRHSADKDIGNTEGQPKNNGGYRIETIQVFWKLSQILAWPSG